MAGEVTILLDRHRSGDDAALDELARMLYPELKALARRRARGSDLGATTLVQETYARYLAGNGLEPSNRQEFFGLAATIMRRIIVDEVRRATASKRDAFVTSLDSEQISDGRSAADFVLAVDRVLTGLKDIDERQRRVFECRYFAGYTAAETAQILDLSTRTVERLWHDARAWIALQLK